MMGNVFIAVLWLAKVRLGWVDFLSATVKCGCKFQTIDNLIFFCFHNFFFILIYDESLPDYIIDVLERERGRERQS